MGRKFKTLGLALAGILVLGFVAEQVVRAVGDPEEKRAQRRLQEIYRQSGGDWRNLTPEQHAEVQRLRDRAGLKPGPPSGSSPAVPPQRDPTQELMYDIYYRRGGDLSKVTPEERQLLRQHGMQIPDPPGAAGSSGGAKASTPGSGDKPSPAPTGNRSKRRKRIAGRSDTVGGA